jgi:hypothetical protein
MGYGASTTARAKQEHVVEPRPRQAAPEALGKSEGVGVVAGGPAACEDDRVDRADRRRVVRDAVEAVDDRLLEWMGHVEAVQPGTPGFGQYRAEIGVGKPERIEVDQPVAVAEAEARTLRLDPAMPRPRSAAETAAAPLP